MLDVRVYDGMHVTYVMFDRHYLMTNIRYLCGRFVYDWGDAQPNPVEEWVRYPIFSIVG